MSVVLDEPPQRLKEQSDQPDVFARLAGQAARDLPQAKPLSPSALARIAASIDQRTPGVTARGRHAWVLVAAAFVLGVVATASAQRLDVVRQWLTGAPAPPAAPRPAPRPTIKGRAGIHAPQPAPVDEPLPETAAPAGAAAPQVAPPAQLAPAAPAIPTARSRTTEGAPSGATVARKLALAEPHEAQRPAVAVTSGTPGLPPLPAEPAMPAKPAPAGPAPVAPASPAFGMPSVPPVPPAAEIPLPTTTAGTPQATEHLTQAVRALRVEHAPKAALRLLDRYDRELERNGFAHEALLLRVEAMLALGQRQDVLRLLDATALTDVTAARALLVTRGELRAAANRCGDALGDFALVLAQARQPPKAALAGRARCRQQLGDRDGAQADLERYRSEYPGDHGLDDLAVPSQPR